MPCHRAKGRNAELPGHACALDNLAAFLAVLVQRAQVTNSWKYLSAYSQRQATNNHRISQKKTTEGIDLHVNY